MYHWFRIVYKSYGCTGSVCTVLTSRSVPASVAPLRLQFFSLAFFSVATLRLIPVIWLPSMSTPFRLAPTTKTHSDEWRKLHLQSESEWSNSSPSRLALIPAGSSKLQPLREAPSALVHSIFTPCRLAACDRQTSHFIYQSLWSETC